MSNSQQRLKVAMLVGTLGRGGAETQLVYMARALVRAGVDLHVYCLTRGEPHETSLRELGLASEWIGRTSSRLLRPATIARAVGRFGPHLIQSTHFYANLYAGFAGRVLRIPSLGAMRSSLRHATARNGRWTPWLIGMPTALLTNSQAARDEMIRRRLRPPERLLYLPNAIDLEVFDKQERPTPAASSKVTALFAGRLIRVKRADRFLHALALACRGEPRLRGVIAGDGPERGELEALARSLDLGSDRLTFLGERDGMPALLGQAQMLVHCSDEEGMPNALLEAMAARLPVITTPAGDAERLVSDGISGYVVPFDAVDSLSERMVDLARSTELRRRLGESGRRHVAQDYDFEDLAGRLLSIYRQVGERQHDRQLLEVLPI